LIDVRRTAEPVAAGPELLPCRPAQISYCSGLSAQSEVRRRSCGAAAEQSDDCGLLGHHCAKACYQSTKYCFGKKQ
jgi:hypothetical protein